ncbi:nephronectin [Nothobranchius furzeri]|nr:nephronectin [Nothobranchius furzeri]
MTETGHQVFMVMVQLILLSAAHQQRSHHRLGEDRLNTLGQIKSDLSVCRKSCVNGKCMRPDKCSCVTGYKGSHCNEDVNECGFSERPCSQRCMNTPGSYRCYCAPRYTLSVDRHTCIRETTCFSLRCQFGCQLERAGVVRCLCPPGLHLAADNRTCEDVDECRDTDVCVSRRKCRNTFGSFVCVCRDGFVMGTLQGSVECRDKDECLIGSHQCSRHSQCINTEGSYTCRCLDEYFGNGRTCQPRRAPQSKAAMYFNYKLSKRTKSRCPSNTTAQKKELKTFN